MTTVTNSGVEGLKATRANSEASMIDEMAKAEEHKKRVAEITAEKNSITAAPPQQELPQAAKDATNNNAVKAPAPDTSGQEKLIARHQGEQTESEGKAQDHANTVAATESEIDKLNTSSKDMRKPNTAEGEPAKKEEKKVNANKEEVVANVGGQKTNDANGKPQQQTVAKNEEVKGVSASSGMS